MIFANGDFYEGEHSHDERHGYGIFTYTNGIQLEGFFKNGNPHGEMIRRSKKKEKKYIY